MQTLSIPDNINIDLIDSAGTPLRQSNILLGIQTFAIQKNNIDIYPFLSNSSGRVAITKEEIKQRADIYISYGIMDYAPLEYAQPHIQIYCWGNNRLDKCIKHWTNLLRNKRNSQMTELERKLLGDLPQRFIDIERRETEELEIFSSCFNRTTQWRQDILLISDSWDIPAKERNYKVSLSL